MLRADSLEKTLMLGKIEARGEGHDRGWDGRIASLTLGHEFEKIPGDSGGQRSLECYSPIGLKRVRHDLTTEHQQQLLYLLSGDSRCCTAHSLKPLVQVYCITQEEKNFIAGEHFIILKYLEKWPSFFLFLHLFIHSIHLRGMVLNACNIKME